MELTNLVSNFELSCSPERLRVCGETRQNIIYDSYSQDNITVMLITISIRLNQ